MAYLRKSFWSLVLWLLGLVGAIDKSRGLIVVVVLGGLLFSGWALYRLAAGYLQPPQTSPGQYVPPSAPPPVQPGPAPSSVGPAPGSVGPGPIVLSPINPTPRQGLIIQAQPMPGLNGVKPADPPPPPLPELPAGVFRGYHPPLPPAPYRPD